ARVIQRFSNFPHEELHDFITPGLHPLQENFNVGDPFGHATGWPGSVPEVVGTDSCVKRCHCFLCCKQRSGAKYFLLEFTVDPCIDWAYDGIEWTVPGF